MSSLREIPRSGKWRGIKLFLPRSVSGAGGIPRGLCPEVVYYYAKDVIDTDNCTGVCIPIWPAFYASSTSVPASLNMPDFGKITDASGAPQTTYLGWPLYTYSGDSAAGQANGDNFTNIWFAAKIPFYSVMVLNRSNANYLTDVRGLTLYYSSADTQGTASATAQSNCAGQCATAWPVFYVSQVVAPSLLSQGDFGSIARPDGMEQLTYKGWPLYFYSGDIQSGDINGNGVNGFEVVVP